MSGTFCIENQTKGKLKLELYNPVFYPSFKVLRNVQYVDVGGQYCAPYIPYGGGFNFFANRVRVVSPVKYYHATFNFNSTVNGPRVVHLDQGNLCHKPTLNVNAPAYYWALKSTITECQ